MRRFLMGAAVVAAAVAAPLGERTPLAQTAPAATTATATARVIVKFRSDSPLLRKQALSASGRQTLQAAALGQRIGIALDAGRGLTDRSHVVVGRGLSSRQLAARIAAERDVEYAVADERKHIVEVPNDPLYAAGPAVGSNSGGPAVGQWYLKPPGAAGDAGNTAPAAINAQQAWDITRGSASVVVAVLDTGVRFDHPDLPQLGGNMLPGYDMVSPDSPGVFTTASDGNGRDGDASDPGDFVTTAEATTACPKSNSSWHGTQTLGLIGALTNNNLGMASVSHGGVKMMPVRVLGKCGGFDSDIQAGMLWAAGAYTTAELTALGLPPNPTPARVLNMSLGGVAACGSYADIVAKVNAAGAVVVVSAGNSTGHAVSSPANCAGAIGVAALRNVGDKVGFSDIGAEITISAPGGNCVNSGTGQQCLYPILTTSNAGTTTPVTGPSGAIYTGVFDPSLGTSFSAPLVSGTVALMLSVNTGLTPAQVKTALKASARPFATTGGTISVGVNSTSPTALSPVLLGAKEPAQCVAPTATDQLECYCTVATCGAGMLDAHAAVSTAAGVAIFPAASPTRRVVSYHWTLMSGGGIVSTLSGADTANVSVTPTGTGTFTVSLTTTDDAGVVSIATSSIDVAPFTAPAAAATGSGGGALGVGWLLLLLAAVLSLALVSARERVAPAAVSAVDRDARTG